MLAALSVAGFHLPGEIGELGGNFAEYVGSAAFGFGAEVLFEITAKAVDLVTDFAAEFFEAVHPWPPETESSAIPVL